MSRSVLPLACASLVVALAGLARADISASFYTAQNDGRDFGPVICCFANNNEVLNTLGPNGLPVYNPSASPVLQDHAANGELTWWTPSAASSTSPGVTFTGATTIAGNSYSNGNFYAPNGTGGNDANGFQTAIFSGGFTFATPQTFTFSLGADDDALMFVDGKAVVLLGGIHGDTPAANTVDLSSGAHTFKLFYADRQQTGAALNFSIPDDVVVTAGVPEPMSWALMLMGFGVVGAATRQRRSPALATV